MNILVLNAGSSTLKYSLLASADERVLAEGTVEVAEHGHGGAVARALGEIKDLAEIGAVGHRVVHGGRRYTQGVRVTPEVKAAIAELSALAPLHNPAALESLVAAEKALPGVPHVAVFDTAFHATLAPEAHVYPLPYAWYTDWGVRRYGFHGLSHAYCSARAAAMIGRPSCRVVVCHLGNGCSVSAVRDGRSVDTSMGFTPMEGLMMGTRCGSVDPGLLLYVLRQRGLTAEALDGVLNHESGLLGVSGVSSDMRPVLAAAKAGNERARLAVDIFAHRVRQTVGAMTATLGGVDALVFTAGIGEHAAEVREKVCAGLEGLNLELDRSANAARKPDADVATTTSRGRILLIATREDLSILRETVRALAE